MNSANRVIVNTAVVYLSLLIKMAIGFFSVRYILLALGETDYGIYMIVAGIASMLDFLNGSMSNTSMRFLAHSLGSNDSEKIKSTFVSTLRIHFQVGMITVIFMELGGWLMINYLLNIPTEKVLDAHVVYQFMVVSMFASIMAVPFDAVMNAHEHIWILSIFELVSAAWQLFIAFYLLYSLSNRLILYGLLVLLIQMILLVAKWFFCKLKYSECSKMVGVVDKEITKSILSFTGWSMFGSLAAIGVSQFRGILVNIFFGVRLNAAAGIASQAANYINQIVASMTRAINPQIMKSEGGGNHNRMIFLVEMGAKYSSFLFALIGVPILIECPYLLELWLKDVPLYTVIFCQLTMLQMLIEKFTFQVTHAIRAVGDIKYFQIYESIAMVLYLPISYVLLKLGQGPEIIYIISVACCFIVALVRLYYGKKVANIHPLLYLKTTVAPLIVPLFVSTMASYFITIFVESSLIRVVLNGISFGLIFSFLFYQLGMGQDERNRWKGIIRGALYKIHS